LDRPAASSTQNGIHIHTVLYKILFTAGLRASPCASFKEIDPRLNGLR
jgi:hypothetical protein